MGRLRWMIAAWALLALAPASAVAAAGDWRIGYAEPADSLNPIVAQASSSLAIGSMAYDNLVNYAIDDVGPDLEHSLAESYEVSRDGRTWTFKLRDDVTWSDGERFTADDVRFTYETILDNPQSALGLATSGLKRIETPDDFTVVLETADPSPVIGFVPMLPEHVWSKLSPKEIGKGPGPTPSVTTGPFVISKFDPRGDTILTANPRYRFGKPEVERAVWIKYGDQPGMLRDIRLGQLDAVSGGRPDWVDLLRGDDEIKLWAADIPNLTMIAFNSCPPGGAGNCEGPGPDTNVAVVQDPAIRKAVNLGVDRRQIVDLVYRGQATAGLTGMIPPFYRAYGPEPEGSDRAQADAARQALADGGWDCSQAPCVKDGVEAEFKLLYDPADTVNAALVQRVRAQLEPIGIKVVLAPQSFDSQLATINAPGAEEGTFRPNYDAVVSGWTGLSFSPDILMSLLQTSTPFAEVYYSNPRYDELFERARATVDVPERAGYFREANAIAREDLPYVVLVNGRSMSLTRNDSWHNYQPAPAGDGAPWGVSPLQIAQLLPGPGDVEPAASTAGEEDGGGLGAGWIAIAAVVIVVAGAGVLVARRRRGQGSGGGDDWAEA